MQVASGRAARAEGGSLRADVTAVRSELANAQQLLDTERAASGTPS